MTIFNVRHTTTYRYKTPVAFGEHRMLFRPRDSYDQRLLHATLDIDPKPASLRWIHDVFGNCVAIATFEGKARELRFESRISLDHEPSKAPGFEMEEYARTYPFSYSAEEMADLEATIRPAYRSDDNAVEKWARQFVWADHATKTGALLMTLTYAIRESFVYSRRTERGTQPPAVTLKLRRGTCRDFALLMIEAVRSLGFAARFVSGYIYVPDRDDGEVRGGGSTHAWCEVYLPGAGWVEFDPTNGIIGNRDLIRVAVARDPSQAIPLSGSWYGEKGDDDGMEVAVQVTTQGVLPANKAEEQAALLRD